MKFKHLIGLTTSILIFVLGYGVIIRQWGSEGVIFSFLLNWMLLCSAAILGHGFKFHPTLGNQFHQPLTIEKNGLYQRIIGIRFYKWLLTKGPLAFLSRLPSEKYFKEDQLAVLEKKTKIAETIHFFLFLISLAFSLVWIVTGKYLTATWIVMFNILMNIYPILIQRYNRVKIYHIKELKKGIQEHGV